MFDWHSEFVVFQARQAQMAGAARFGRLLAEASASRARPGQGGRSRKNPDPDPGLRGGAAWLMSGDALPGSPKGLGVDSCGQVRLAFRSGEQYLTVSGR